MKGTQPFVKIFLYIKYLGFLSTVKALKQEHKAFQVGETLLNYHVLITQFGDKNWGGGIKRKSHHAQTSRTNIMHKHLNGL